MTVISGNVISRTISSRWPNIFFTVSPPEVAKFYLSGAKPVLAPDAAWKRAQ